MAKDPAFLFYSSDFLTGTMFMTDEQVGVYIRLLCAQHQHGGRIDTNVLRTYCDRITNGDTVAAKFAQDDRGSFNERLEIEMQKRAEKSEKARESVNKRWEKQTAQMPYERNTNVIRSENENVNEDVNENRGMRVQGERGLTVTKKELSPRTPDTIRSYFAEHGQPDEADKFIDYYQSNGWKVGRNAMKDWQATARNWMRRAQPNQKDRRIVRNTTVADIQDTAKRLAKLMGETNENDNDSGT